MNKLIAESIIYRLWAVVTEEGHCASEIPYIDFNVLFDFTWK